MKIQGIKKDIILVSALAAAGALIFAGAMIFSKQGKSAEVRVDGRVTAVYPLDTELTVSLNGTGGSNLLVIENGEAYIKEADCPDGLCIRTGRISRTGQTVICLPHKLVVEITDGRSGTDRGSGNIDIIVK